MVGIRQRLLPDERAADLRFALEDGVLEAFVLDHVLIEELRQLGHGKIVAGPHKRELEEADYDRREEDVAPVVVLHVHDEPASGHLGHLVAEFVTRDVELAGQRVQRDGLAGDPPGELGVFRLE